MEFLPPLADASDYPKVTVFANATNITFGGNQRNLPSNVSQQLLVDKGRTALVVVAKAIKEGVVWLPSYHCPALVEPFVLANKNVRFYPVKKDLSPCEEFLHKNVKNGHALVAVRYFGFDCGIQKTAELCNRLGITLIEDLAHAAFVDKLFGNVAITSLTKFYPSIQAGELLLTQNCQDSERYFTACHQLPHAIVSKLKVLITKIVSKFLTSPQISRYIDESAMSMLNQRDIAKSVATMSQKTIVEKRRANFEVILKWLDTCNWAKPLFELCENVVPYVVPIIIIDIVYFEKFRQAGIQVLRWEALSVDIDCSISQSYRRHLIQIPCHQDLNDNGLLKIKTILEN